MFCPKKWISLGASHVKGWGLYAMGPEYVAQGRSREWGWGEIGMAIKLDSFPGSCT